MEKEILEMLKEMKKENQEYRDNINSTLEGINSRFDDDKLQI